MSDEGPQMQTFTTKPVTDDTTIAEEPSMNATIDVSMEDSLMKDDTIEEPVHTSSTPLKKKQNESAAESQGEEEEPEVTGTSVLPLSKIKKIFKTDPDHVTASDAAVFTTAIATELFIQYFTEQASLIARADKRKKLQYKDFSAAVANIEQLYFLVDTVPKTHNLEGLVKTNKVKYSKEKTLGKGQHTLNFHKKGTEDSHDANDSDVEDLGDINDAEGMEESMINDDAGDATDNEEEEPSSHPREDGDHDIIMN